MVDITVITIRWQTTETEIQTSAGLPKKLQSSLGRKIFPSFMTTMQFTVKSVAVLDAKTIRKTTLTTKLLRFTMDPALASLLVAALVDASAD
jgi:hypothetical protein